MQTFAGHCRSLILLAVVLCLGCGADKYKARLNETAQYFRYKEKLAAELNPVWSEMGVSLQPPRQFVRIAPPPQPADDEELELEAAEDPRQPHYLGIELPGLLGAWEATVQTDVGGEDEPRQAYLYVLGNHGRFLDVADDGSAGMDPGTFSTDLVDLLSGTVGVVLPMGETGTGVEKNERYHEVAPRVEPNVKFTPKKQFTAVTLSPQIDAIDLGLPYEMQLYEWNGSDIQVAILMVYPQSVSPREKLHERLLLTLETVNVDDVAPSVSSQSGSSPSSGGGIAF